MNVASMMSTPVFTATKDTPLAEVVRTMKERRVSAIPVVDHEQKIIGVVTVADLIPQARNAPASNVQLMSLQDEYVDFASIGSAYEKLAGAAASEVMQDRIVTVRPDVEIGTAARMMIEHKLGALPVVRDDGVLVGIVTRTDLARLVIDGHKASGPT
jgi:CBS domain-containing protein